MSAKARPRLGLIVAASVILSVTLLGLPTQQVAAHCPGSQASGGRDYAAGKRSIANSANGIKADIQYTLKPVCAIPAGNAFSAEAIYLCINSLCDGFVQVGWERSQSGTLRMYCEFQPPPATGTGFIFYFSVTAATHNYKMQYDPLDSVWDCFLDGAWKKDKGGLGFTTGTYLGAQGETNSTHTQLGRNSPSTLQYTTLQYRIAMNNTWNTWSPNTFTRDPPYGASNPAVGSFADWTNVPHN